MPDKVTLWRIPTGMHYTTQSAAEIAEAEAELDAFLRHAGLGEDTRDTITRLALREWPGIETHEPTAVEGLVKVSPNTKGPERGADVLARYAAVLKRRAADAPGQAGSDRELQALGLNPAPVPVAEPVRRRAIRSEPREPVTPEGDSPGPVDWGHLPRPIPVARRSSPG